MPRRSLCLLLLLAANLYVVPADAFAQKRPDIVVMLSDDHSRRDSGVYGSTEAPTPNMTRLAAAGMTFDNAYVASPSCAPSRAALLTGLTPQHNGAIPNHARPRADIKKLPAYLQELGYEVVAFGKVGHYAQTPEYGFDLARHFSYHDDQCVAEAVDWLSQRPSDSRPLCLMVGTNWPHVPWPPHEQSAGHNVEVPANHVETSQTVIDRARYLEAVETMDRDLGSVIDAAKQHLGEDTLFIHTSDHGAQWPFGKWTLYDDGIRTPLIVAWPGKVAAGSRSQALVSWLDLLPTMVDAAGGEPPPGLDGQSLLPVLTGRQSTHRDLVFTTHSGDGNFNVYPIRAVTDGRFKLIRNLFPQFRFESHVTTVRENAETTYWESWEEKAQQDPKARSIVDRHRSRPAEEFYDTASDPSELRNLIDSSEHADRIAALRQELDGYIAAQDDQKAIYGIPKLLPPQQPLNIVTVFIDDMGWRDLSCFGNTEASTPNIDRMAAGGLRLTQFYVNSPICSPSRTALTTGQYPARHRITSYLAHRQLNAERGVANWLEPSAPTIPRMLHEAGYATGHFGKWHMGGQRDVGEAPLIPEYGFDASLTNFEGLGPRVLPLLFSPKGGEPKRHALGSDQLGRGEIRWEDRAVVTGSFVDAAVDFIDTAAAAGKPFFVNLWPDDVHSPFHPPLDQWTRGDKRRQYLTVLEEMDRQLDPLFRRIEEDPTLRDRTVIFIASDNGPEAGAGSSGDLRGRKGQLYEGGIRSPLIVWSPAAMKPEAIGTVNETTVASSIDVSAAMLTLGAAQPPSDYRGDGIDLAGIFLGYSTAERNTPLMWRRPPDHPGKPDMPLPDLAIREGDWKLLCDVDGGDTELFDLAADPQEQNNLADRRPKIAQRLRSDLLKWNAELPVDGVANRPE